MKGLVRGIPKSFQQNWVGSITNFDIEEGTKGRVIPLVFSPESLSDSVQANFQQTTIPGASAPQVTFTATGARTVSFSIVLPLDYLPPSTEYENLEDYLNAFRALVYPKYLQSGKVKSPHCKLLLSNIELDGVCSQCSIEYKVDRVANDGSLAANVSLSFIEVLDNVHNVDAQWIANSKVNVLKGTTVTTQTSNYDEFIENSTGSVVETGKCNVAIKGNKDVYLTSSESSLRDLINSGEWTDPGYNYNRKDKYTIKKLYGCVPNSNAIVSNIRYESTGFWKCTVNSNYTVSLQSSPPNGYQTMGEDITYFILYIPVYDGNVYEMDSMVQRNVHVHIKER